MRVCLISPRGVAKQSLAANESVSFPHGLLQIAASTIDAGHECEIFDCDNKDLNFSYDHFNSFDVVGFSVMTTQLQHGVEIANNLNKNVRVVWGGIHCIFDPESILNRFPDHFVITGEGETPFVKLLDYFEGKEPFESIKDHKGINYYIDRPVINPAYFNKRLDDLPDIDFYILPHLEKYIHKKHYYMKSLGTIPTLEVVTSRGCVWDCSFCINTIFKDNRSYHRGKTIEKIRRETEGVIDDFDIQLVFPRDEDFFANTKLIDPWAEYAREKEFFWGVSARYNYFKPKFITPERVKYFVDSGLMYLGMSIEAGDEDIRNNIIDKALKDEEIYKTVDDINKFVGADVIVNTSFIVDFPGDTEKNKIETIKWMYYLTKNLNVTLSGPQIYRPYPGTHLYDKEHHKTGDMNFYLEMVNGDDEIPADMNYTSYFYSKALVYYLNWSTKFFKIRDDKQRSHPDSFPHKELVSSKKGIGEFLFRCLLVTIDLRVKFDFWKFFFEPSVIGWVWCRAREKGGSKFIGPLLRKIKYKSGADVDPNEKPAKPINVEVLQPVDC